MRRDADLAVTAPAAAGAAAGTFVPGLRVAAGLLLVVALPGYALSVLAVPAVPDWFRQVNSSLWRGMWTVGLSLATAVVAGLLLNLTPGGLTRTSWAVSLAGVTLVAVAAAAWRRRRTAAADGARDPLAVSPATSAPPRRRVTAGYALAALALAGTATGLAVASAGWQRSPGFAQLWLVPAHGAVAAGEQATLGVRSGYHSAETFELVLRRGTEPAEGWAFTLAAGQAWQQTVTAPAGQPITARLTVAGQPAAAQTVSITSP